MKKVTIIGAGLAGSEAAWQVAKRGTAVLLIEMRPNQQTKAHQTGLSAELVCSNSFRGSDLSNAVGLLKEELKLFDSLIMEAALATEVPAGGCLAVDRLRFSEYVDKRLKEHPLIEVQTAECKDIPSSSKDCPVILATGPLTAAPLAKEIAKMLGQKHLAFFDAISPILYLDSLDLTKVFKQSRYDKGGDDYLNIPLEKEDYQSLIQEVLAAEKYTGNQEVENDCPEDLKPFEGCMPIEDLAERGIDTARFGPLKPKGLVNPETGKEPYAVIQLRQDNTEGTLWNMVGMQTRMKRADQQRVFSALAGLAKAEFARYGSVHRNTFINSPKCLLPTLEYKSQTGLFFAGQMTGVEGYVESCAGGLVAGINAYRVAANQNPVIFPKNTAIGGLMDYISDPGRLDFQPMNINFGLISGYSEMLRAKKRKLGKRLARQEFAQLALQNTKEFIIKLIEA